MPVIFEFGSVLEGTYSYYITQGKSPGQRF